MSLLPRSFRDGGLLTWRNLLALLWLNLIWVALAWTLVLAGPATLASYALIAGTMREDRDLDLRQFLPLLRRNLLPGIFWALTAAVFAFLVYSNVTFWRRVLGPFGDTVVALLAAYLSWLFVALQPYLLEALSVDRLPHFRAWRAAFLGLVQHPLNGHLFVLIPLLVLVLSVFFQTFVFLILGSVTLAFAATQVRPLVTRDSPPDDLPETPTDSSPGQAPSA